MIASAVLVKRSQLKAIPAQRDWQTAAWDYYDRVPELRFGAQWLSNALSRCRLYVGVPGEEGAGEPQAVNPDESETGSPEALVPLKELFAGQHGDMLARLAIHLTVPGESYLVAVDRPVEEGNTAAGVRRTWIVASGEEFSKKQRGVKVRLPDSDEEVDVDLDNSTVIRIWRPHARKAWEADAPTRALLPVLKELLDLTAHITASVESRLAGAGVLFMPEETTMPAPPSNSGQPLHEDPAMATFIDAMVTPVQDRDSASALVPIIARVPASTQGKTVAKPQFMTFATPLDEKVQALREAAIRRIATGLDMPAELLLGLGESSTNHWTAWQLEESSVKLHIEPLLALVCQSLTEKYLRPALEATGVPDADKYVIWFDASELTLRPNRTPEAQTLHKDLKLKDEVLLRESGFGVDDLPDPEEFKRNVVLRLVLSGVSPEVAAPYLSVLGIELPTHAHQEPGDDVEPPPGEETDEVPPDGQTGRPELPDTPGAPGNATPDPAVPPLAAAAAAPPVLVNPGAALDRWPLRAVEMAVVQALSHAGKKLLSWGGRQWRGRIDCPAWEIHTRIPPADFDADKLLDGAYACLDEVLGDQPCVKATVDGYVRGLLTLQRRHESTGLQVALEQAGCLYGGGSDARAA